MPISADRLFEWHERPGAFERLTPPWDKVELIRKDPSLEVGSQLHIKTSIGPLSMLWISEHTGYIRGKEFTDTQIRGPFSHWTHRHQMIPHQGQSIMRDSIAFKTPLNLGAQLAHQSLKRLFKYRHTILSQDLCIQEDNPSPPLNIAINNTSLLGKNYIAPFLRSAGHTVYTFDESFDGQTSDCTHLIYSPPDLSSPIDFADNLKALVSHLEIQKKSPQVILTPIPLYFDSEAIMGIASGGSKTQIIPIPFGIPLSLGLSPLSTLSKWPIRGSMNKEGDTIHWVAIDDLIYAIYKVLIDPITHADIKLISGEPVSKREFYETLSHITHRSWRLPLPFDPMSQNGGIATQWPSLITRESLYHPKLEGALAHLLGKGAP